MSDDQSTRTECAFENTDHAIDCMVEDGIHTGALSDDQPTRTGLFHKYTVYDRTPHGRSEYPLDDVFVLRPERDLAARAALATYADTTTNKELATDLWKWIAKMNHES